MKNHSESSKFGKIKRTHDKLYLEGERRKKDYFELIWDEIANEFANRSIDLLDVGCATGDFIYYSRELFPNISFYGLDIMPELLRKIDFQGITTFCGDISKKTTLPSQKYDCITMLGVMSIFDDFVKILDNTFYMLKEDGVVLLFGIFNPEDIDVYIKSKPSGMDSFFDTSLESGWNIYSKKSIEMYCITRGFSCSFIPFEIETAIKKNELDPLRSWTIDANGKYIIINGLQIIHHFFLCKIKRR